MMADAQTINTVRVKAGERDQLDFQIGEGNKPACFCLGVRKSGSTMLNRVVINLAKRNNFHTVDIPGTFFKSGYKVADWMKADLTDIVRPNNCYIGYRSYPKNLEAYEPFRRGKKIFMHRDPRDALVSQYFSDAYSHSLPSAKTEAGQKAAQEFLEKRKEAQATSIETYVLEQAPSIQRTLMSFAHLLDDPTCLVLRYEDYVFQKNRMIHKILHHFGWEAKLGQIEQILAVVDEIPDKEDKTKFVRAVVPGDHRRKLSPETIRKLNNRMEQVLHTFDYY